jgi:hypothetical protein
MITNRMSPAQTARKSQTGGVTASINWFTG